MRHAIITSVFCNAFISISPFVTEQLIMTPPSYPVVPFTA